MEIIITLINKNSFGHEHFKYMNTILNYVLDHLQITSLELEIYQYQINVRIENSI